MSRFRKQLPSSVMTSVQWPSAQPVIIRYYQVYDFLFEVSSNDEQIFRLVDERFGHFQIAHPDAPPPVSYRCMPFHLIKNHALDWSMPNGNFMRKRLMFCVIFQEICYVFPIKKTGCFLPIWSKLRGSDTSSFHILPKIYDKWAMVHSWRFFLTWCGSSTYSSSMRLL